MSRSGEEAIYDFQSKWRNSRNFEIHKKGNLFFCAEICYNSNKYGIEQEDDCIVQIFRDGGGRIEIISKGIFRNETHHLGFNGDYQDYEFDEDDGSLIVYGDAPKMEGEYTVRITPNGEKPTFNK